MLRTKTRLSNNLPNNPVAYPIGSFLKTEKGYFYIVSSNKRYRLVSERVVASWCPHRIIPTTEAAVSRYRIAAKMKFRPGSLIHNLADGKLYLIENGLKRHVTSPDALKAINASWNDAITVSEEEINLHDEGEPLSW